ncbi:MAG: BrnT family toxin [Novosphingobium sp.]
MEIEYDPAKRDQVLAERGLDMARCGEAFDGFYLTRRDDKHSDDEERYTSLGTLDSEVVIIVWTPRDSLRRIVTMWKANEKERQKFEQARKQLG